MYKSKKNADRMERERIMFAFKSSKMAILSHWPPATSR